MADIIPIHDPQHRETEALLPWYVTGRLDAGERALVEAHLAECPDCRAELAMERRLGQEVAALPLEAGSGWAAMQQRLTQTAPRRQSLAEVWRDWFRRIGLGWQRATQLAFVTAAGVLVSPLGPLPAYQTLGAPPVRSAGNALVMFRPDAREQALRDALIAADARLVDGPTPAAAYVIAVPAHERATSLAKLRARSDVLLAEPIDPESGS